MKIIDCEQGSHEWHMARLGLPTASNFNRILTSKTLKYAAGAETYRNELLAETLTGSPLITFESYWTERGHEQEPKARMSYEFLRGVEVERVGFITTDDGKVGCSPDSLVGFDGGLELKCPAPHTHVGYLLAPDSLVDEYRHQVQGCLYVTGREWWDLVSYYPGLEPVVVRVEPDPEYQRKLDAALTTFLADLDAAKAQLGLTIPILEAA